MRSRLLRLAIAALLLLAVGCGSAEAHGTAMPREPLLVMAASSLSTAMPALVDHFESVSGTEVDLVLSSSGNLAAQVENGAPADLFFSADEATVERLVSRGIISRPSVRTYALGELVIVWREGTSPPASLEALADPRYELIAIANPEIAPYGAAAREALAGVWDRVAPRIVQGESVAQTYRFVQTGNADVAIVARSVIDTAATPSTPVDAMLHPPVRHAAGVLERSTNPASGEFLAFVLSREGQAILARFGFGPAPR